MFYFLVKKLFSLCRTRRALSRQLIPIQFTSCPTGRSVNFLSQARRFSKYQSNIHCYSSSDGLYIWMTRINNPLDTRRWIQRRNNVVRPMRSSWGFYAVYFTWAYHRKLKPRQCPSFPSRTSLTSTIRSDAASTLKVCYSLKDNLFNMW